MERRDQVLIGLRSFFADAICTFLARCRSTNGPFLSERGMTRLVYPDCHRIRFLRRCTIMLSVRLLCRVLSPLAFWPQGDTGCGLP